MSNPVCESSSGENEGDPPVVPPDSPGSSVSSRLEEEYDELLKYAVVVPEYDARSGRRKLIDIRGTFDRRREEDIFTVRANHFADEEDNRKSSEEEVTPRSVRNHPDHDVRQLPDFGQSPITVREDSKSSSFREQQKKDTLYGKKDDFKGPFFNPLTLGEREKLVRIGREATEMVYSSTVDTDVGKLETMLDHWCLELKRNVLGEFSNSKIHILQKSRDELNKEMERHASEKNALFQEMDSMKELLHTYEQSSERKDQVISNLTDAMSRQRSKIELVRRFCDWRAQHTDAKREAFATKLAQRHYERTICQRVWDAWFSIIQAKWRQRVEKACQIKAQEVCLQLTTDYESKISSLNEALEASRLEVKRLYVQRDRYEEAMKKAFMRGVCALNMEAMNMFHGDDEDGSTNNPARKRSEEELLCNSENISPDREAGHANTTSVSSAPLGLSGTKIVTSQGPRSVPAQSQLHQTATKLLSATSGTSSNKTHVSARVSGKKSDSSKHTGRSTSPVLNPPMASVIVERHQPVTKQTIGHAIASKYPRQAASDGAAYKRLAGQGVHAKIMPQVQTIHVVE